MDAIIGYVVALTLSLLGIAGFITWASNSTTNVQTALTASQMVVFDQGALLFVEDNEQFLLANATSSKAYVVTASQLVNGDTGTGRSGATGGYLPSAFTATNVFGQTWNLYVVQPSNGILQALAIAQGGNMISDQVQLMQIAAQAGTQGGFVPVYPNSNESRNLNIDQSMTPDTAYGASSGWKVKLQGSGTDIPYPGNGHLVSLLSFTPRHFVNDNDYLYRVPEAPSGHPEFNQMQTDLGMTGSDDTAHQFYGASAYKMSDGGGLSTTGGGALDLGGSATQAGTGTPSINFQLGGSNTQSINAQIVNDDDDHLQVKGEGKDASLQVQGTLQTGNVAVDGGPCEKNGLIATDTSGVLYSCVLGVWTASSSPPIAVAISTYGNFVSALPCPGGQDTLMIRASETYPLPPDYLFSADLLGQNSGNMANGVTVIPFGSSVMVFTYQSQSDVTASRASTIFILICKN